MSELLSLEEIVVEFDGFRVLDKLSLSLAEGELRFLIGPNGAGKTTLLDLLTGRVRPANGRVHFRGVDLARQAENKIVQLGIGRKFQTPAVYRSLTCAEHLEVAVGFRRAVPAWFGQMNKLERARIRA